MNVSLFFIFSVVVVILVIVIESKNNFCYVWKIVISYFILNDVEKYEVNVKVGFLGMVIGCF